MTILAAIGGEPPESDVLRVAYDLATTYDDDLVALHVIPDEAFDAHQAAIEGTPAYEHFTINHEEASARKIARHAVTETLDDTYRVEPRGRVGDPAKKILEEADITDARYLVIGAKRRSPVGKALFGSTTQRILLNATKPVVTVAIDDDN